PPTARALIALGVLAPLIRPEGALASLMVAVALGVRRERGRRALLALAPLAGPLVIPLLNRALTGHAASTTAQVKCVIAKPCSTRATLFAAFGQNVRTLVTNLMDGGDWTVIFLPEHSSIPILLGAVLLPVAAVRRRLRYHALFVAMVALGSLAPC